MLHLFALIGESFREAFFMFWETMWALVLGFTLSGMVQAFVSRGEMQRAMGDGSIGSISRATFFGMVSSSCSYAATAMARSLFQRGANFAAAMVFMFASTNLVIEIGLVLWILMGWQFALSEYVGGLIMIALFALLSRFVFAPRIIDAARRHVAADESSESEEPMRVRSWRERLSSSASWADAASYAMADINMLRKEMAVGFIVAGFLAVIVPNRVWNTVFVTGHGFWTSLENAVVGPLIAVVSFVCSIGNVPLAAALWSGGIGFGGVVSFIFADLITLPLVLIYRKLYGLKLTLRLVALFWLVMSAAGLIVEYLFVGLGLVPENRSIRIVETSLEWNYTTFLNIIFLGVFALLFWLSRNQERLGGGAGYATDPVCGMQVEKANAPARRQHEGETYHFCSEGCADAFERDPGRYTKASSREGIRSGS